MDFCSQKGELGKRILGENDSRSAELCPVLAELHSMRLLGGSKDRGAQLLYVMSLLLTYESNPKVAI